MTNNTTLGGGAVQAASSWHLPSLQSLLLAESTLGTQLALLLLNAVAWRLCVPWVGRNVARPYYSRQPWFAQWSTLTQQSLQSAFGIALDKEESDAWGFEMVGIQLQHGVGGLLALPAVLGWFSPQVRVALAIHGALCEAGWELQDGLWRLYAVTLGDAQERARNPPALLKFIVLHHLLGLSMVLPLNMVLRENALYHEGVWLLQGAAFFAIGAQTYSYTLDTRTVRGVWKMRAAVSFVFSVYLYTRIVRFSVIVLSVLALLYDTSVPLFAVGLVAALGMGHINVVFVTEAGSKVRKFWLLPASHARGTPHQKRLLRQASSDAVSAMGGPNVGKAAPLRFAAGDTKKLR